MDLKQLAKDLSIEDLKIFVDEYEIKKDESIMQTCESLFYAFPECKCLVLCTVHRCYDAPYDIYVTSCTDLEEPSVEGFEDKEIINNLRENNYTNFEDLLEKLDSYQPEYDEDSVYPGESLIFYVERNGNTFTEKHK